MLYVILRIMFTFFDCSKKTKWVLVKTFINIISYVGVIMIIVLILINSNV